MAFDQPCFVIDISCDPAIGFPFSRTTTFHTPSYKVGNAKVYSVDHILGYFEDAGAWVYTHGLSPWLIELCMGINHWLENETIRPAVEILHGKILNDGIIEYQNRTSEVPHSCESQLWRIQVDKTVSLFVKK